MKLLLELLDKSLQDPDVKESKPFADQIAHLLFKKKGGPVVDKKRSKLPIFYGVANDESRIQSVSGKKVSLTFDNSTDSGEFEINSLTPLMVQKGSPLDKEVKRLYGKHKVRSSKKMNYTMKGATLVLREVHLGKNLNERAVEFVKDLIPLLNSDKISREAPVAKDEK